MTAEEAYNATIDDLNALEQAIEEICDRDTVHVLQARKKAILRR